MYGAERVQVPDRWVAEAAWGFRARWCLDTKTAFNPGLRQAALHVHVDQASETVRLPVCLFRKDNIDSVLLGSLRSDGPPILHGTVVPDPSSWMAFMAYDQLAKEPYFDLPLSELRPIDPPRPLPGRM